MKATRRRRLRSAAMVRRRWGKRLRQLHRATMQYIRDVKRGAV